MSDFDRALLRLLSDAPEQPSDRRWNRAPREYRITPTVAHVA
jgi:hypothetical protein